MFANLDDDERRRAKMEEERNRIFGKIRKNLTKGEKRKKKKEFEKTNSNLELLTQGIDLNSDNLVRNNTTAYFQIDNTTKNLSQNNTTKDFNSTFNTTKAKVKYNLYHPGHWCQLPFEGENYAWSCCVNFDKTSPVRFIF